MNLGDEKMESAQEDTLLRRDEIKTCFRDELSIEISQVEGRRLWAVSMVFADFTRDHRHCATSASTQLFFLLLVQRASP